MLGGAAHRHESWCGMHWRLGSIQWAPIRKALHKALYKALRMALRKALRKTFLGPAGAKSRLHEPRQPNCTRIGRRNPKAP